MVRRALAVAATDSSAMDFASQIGALQVVGRCGCGCASVDFRVPVRGWTARVVAEAAAKAPGGESLGLIVWALEGELSGLEVYTYSEDPAPLPLVESICSHDEAVEDDAA